MQLVVAGPAGGARAPCKYPWLIQCAQLRPEVIRVSCHTGPRPCVVARTPRTLCVRARMQLWMRRSHSGWDLQAIPIAEALQQLPSSARALAEEADIMSTMNWPPAVLTTRNFLNPSSQRAVVASHVRKADALLLFPDGSALLLSERECELVVRALRQQPAAANTQVLLVHLACAQEMGMTAHNAGNSDACGRLGLLSAGNRGIVADPFIAQRVQQALVAAQLFNGETEFGETQPDMRLMSQGSGAALRWLVFGVGDRQCRCVLSGREGRDAAHQLVRAREQAMCWPGSALEAVCQRQISAENVEAGENRSQPKWGWVSPASPFLK